MSVTKLAAISLMLCMACLGTAWGQAEGPQRYFNIKAGPVYVVVSAMVSTEYTDNVNLSNGKTTPIQPELTIYPSIGINAATQVKLIPSSELNTSDLRFTTNLGYRDYVFHSQLNQKVVDINVSPDSELSLLIHAGHFKIRLHDGFSLQSDPATDGSLSNIAQFRRFVNTVGVSTLWDVNSKTKVNFSYNHSNLYALSITTLGNTNSTTSSTKTTSSTTSSSKITSIAQIIGSTKNTTATAAKNTGQATTYNNVSSLNSWTDAASLSADCQVFSLLNVGFTTSVQATSFPAAPSQDTTSYSYGPTASLRLSQYTTLTASCGITQNRMGNAFTGTPAATGTTSGDSNTNYFDLTLANQLNTYYSHTLSIGRQVSLGILGDQNEVDYVRYTSSWRVNSHISISTGIFAENTTNLGSLLGGSYRYRRYGCSLSTSYRLSGRMSTTLDYRVIDKLSNDPTQSYKQNTITWTINYQF